MAVQPEIRTYTNPVYPGDFPDPFVLRFNGRYYAYGSGPADDGRYFRMLSSRDLVTWEPHGGALPAPDLPGVDAYWAPEVAYSEGRFYLYYAAGNDANPDHHLRLAAAEHPLGPWTDAGVNLTPREIFAIDAHPFRDPQTGEWYLFYARDELEPPFAGTGNVVDRLTAMDRLEGDPRRVTRPYAPWQVFELKRAIKHDLDWYTIEGPFVVEHEGGYVCFYSGGRWENPNYGVGYAVAAHPLGPWEDLTNAGSPTVLKTVPCRVIGPGHNCVVAGPDLMSQWIVYHGWDRELRARYPRIDPLVWVKGEPFCDGPSSEPRAAPRLPDLAAWFDEAEPGPEWSPPVGEWRREKDGLVAGADLVWEMREPAGSFVAETAVRATAGDTPRGLRIGEVPVQVAGEALRVGETSVPLPSGFRHDAWHRLLVRREGETVSATLDAFPSVTGRVPEGPNGRSVVGLAGGAGAAFSHFALTKLR